MRLVFLLLCLSIYGTAITQLNFAGAFQVTPGGAGALVTLTSNGSHSINHTFNTTGSIPSASGAMVAGADGNLYFAANSNRIYKMGADGASPVLLATLPRGFYRATRTENGSTPVFGPDGMLYLTTENDKLIRVATDGSGFTEMGFFPHTTRLTISSDGWIYGAATVYSPVFRAMISKIKTDGTGYQVLHMIDKATEGFTAGPGMLLAPNGRLFGTMRDEGPLGKGTVYSLLTDGSDFKVHITDLTSPDCLPVYQNGRVFFANRGNDGSLFSLDIEGNDYTPLQQMNYNFTYSTPLSLLGGNDGKLYGIAVENTVLFSIKEDGTEFEILHAPDQANYYYNNQTAYTQPLLLNGKLFWNCPVAGKFQSGYLMSVDITTKDISYLVDYGAAPGGTTPSFGLVKDNLGYLYGVLSIGGSDGGGIIYQLNPDGTGFMVLHEFTGTAARHPNGKLLIGSDGMLYGVCRDGGPSVYFGGVMFRMFRNGSGFSIIHQFGPAMDEIMPGGNLTEGPDGTLYGVTQGKEGYAPPPAIYKINKDGSGFTILKKMDNDPVTFRSLGLLPSDGLILYNDYLYGSCKMGGDFFNGTVYRIHKSGADFRILLHGNSNTIGAWPECGLTVTSTGKIAGAFSRGTSFAGSLFTMNPDGTGLSVTYPFNYTDVGAAVVGRMIEGSDGKMYGTTLFTPGSGGTLFRTNLDGSGFTKLYTYPATAGFNSSAELVEINYLAPLPVQLIAFHAEKKKGGTNLSWTTAQEINTELFSVERSTDGRNFNPIGFKKAAGNTSSGTSYSFTDSRPFHGANHYRLKITDTNGSFQYSSVRSVLYDAQPQLVVQGNPAANKLGFIHNLKGSKITIRITDMWGKALFQETDNNQVSSEISVASLPPGIYVLSVSDGSVILSEKFIKK